MVICLKQGANDVHMVQLMSLPPHHLFINIQIGLTFVMLDDEGYPGKEAVKRMSVCPSSIPKVRNFCCFFVE